MIALPILLLLAGTATLAGLLIASRDVDRDIQDRPADLPNAPIGKTRWSGVNAILDELRKAASASGIPLGLLVGWIAKEAGGKLATHPQPGPGDTKYDERGYFQLMPDESKSLGLDHQRLSTDSQYSINAGLALISKYRGDVDKLHVAPDGSAYYWRLVKLAHSAGAGAMAKWVAAAKDAGAVGSWSAFETWAKDHDAQLLHETKHSPKKWLDFVDEVYAVGIPFGFGNDTQQTVVGGAFTFPDIVDPLDVLLPRKAR